MSFFIVPLTSVHNPLNPRIASIRSFNDMPAHGRAFEDCFRHREPAAQQPDYLRVHAHAGAALSSRWNFPEALTDTVLRHHALDDVPLSTAKDPVLASVVRVGDLCAHDSLVMDEEESTLKSADDDEAWDVLDRAPDPIAKADRVAVLTEIVSELKDSPPPQF